MSLASGLRVGGVYVDVRLDTSRLRDDMRRARDELGRYAREGVGLSGAAGGVGLAGSTTVINSGGSTGGLVGAIRATGSVQASLLRQAVASLRTIATAQSNQDRAARSAFRAERGQFRQAGLRQAGGWFAGRAGFLSGPEGRVNSLPADVRYLGGIGFDEARPFKTPGDRAAMAAAKTAADQASATVKAAAARAAYSFTSDFVTGIGVTGAAAAAGARPGHYQRRRNGDVGWQFGNNGGPRESGNFRGSASRRSGSADPFLLPRAGLRLGMAAVGAVGGSIDASFLALNRFQSGMEGMRRGLDRMHVTLGPVRAALSGTFNAALLPLRLFSRNADESVRHLGAMRTIAGGLGAGLAMPFRLSLVPARLLLGALGDIARTLAFVGTLAVGTFAVKGVRAATEMAETVNVADQTFGRFSARVQADAAAMADRFGLVQESMLETSNAFGLLLTGMGMGAGEAARMSSRLAALTADMSSFFNVSQGDAAGAITSALRGQFRPASRFGVVIRKEDVTALAEARGQAGRLGEAMATVSLITAGLSPAMGDLERTMNSTANLGREIGGRFANLAGTIGETFLPAVREGMLLITDLFAMGEGESGPLLGALRAAGEWTMNLIRGVRVLAANWRSLVEIVVEVGRGIGRVFGGLFGWLTESAGRFLGWFRENWMALIMDMGRSFEAFIANFSANIANLTAALRDFAAGKGWNFEARGLLDGFTPSTSALPDLPELDLGIDETLGNIRDIFAGMAASIPGLRGVAGDATGEGTGRGILSPEMGDDGGGAGGRSGARLVSAEQLVEMQNQSSSDRDAARRTAEHTRRTADGVDQLVRQMAPGGGGAPAVAAP